MKRRNFIKNLSLTSGAAFTLGGVPLQLFGRPQNLARLANTADNDKVLIILQLHGGNDGLNMLIPVDRYDEYYSRRANIAIPAKNSVRKMIPLDSTLPSADQIGLHPDMGDVKELYDNGRVKMIQGVSYKNNNGSHFRGRDIWFMGGGFDDYYSSGWIGRYLQSCYKPLVYPNDFPNEDMKDPLAIEMGSDVSLIFHQDGNIPTSISLGSNPDSLARLIDELEGFEDEGIDPRGKPPSFLDNTPYGKELNWILGLEDKIEDYAERLVEVYDNSSESGVEYPELYPFNAPKGSLRNRLTGQLKLISRLIDGGGDGLKTKVFLLRLGGFDTHAEQVESYDPTMGSHAALMYHISSAMKAFQEDLKQRGIEDRVLTITTSEFGRRIGSNGSFGTDHGTGGPVMMFGSGVNPGVLGTNPDLSKGNVDMQFDYRQLYAGILKDWFEVDESVIVNDILYRDFLNGIDEDGNQYEPLPLIGNNNVVTSVDEFFEARFSVAPIYPNPVKTSFILSIQSITPVPVSIQIIDVSGRVVKNIFNRIPESGKLETKISVEGMRPGIYQCNIKSGQLSRTQKLIIHPN